MKSIVSYLATANPGRVGVLTLAAFGLIASRLPGAASPGASDGDDFRITVRSQVEQKYTRFSKEPLRDHGKSYAIIALDHTKGAPLAKPENEAELLAQVRATLAARGFHAPMPGTNPDIVLTVFYGRGYLKNPYLDKVMEVEEPFGAGNGEGRSVGGTAQVVTASVDQMIREKSTPGYADKVISASTEKLFIVVTAWKFPATATEKPQEVWRTTVLSDDPDQDLNQLSRKMLAAAGGYFDHPIEQDELTINSRIAEGLVNVGAPTVVDPRKAEK